MCVLQRLCHHSFSIFETRRKYLPLLFSSGAGRDYLSGPIEDDPISIGFDVTGLVFLQSKDGLDQLGGYSGFFVWKSNFIL